MILLFLDSHRQVWISSLLSRFIFYILTGWPSHVHQRVGAICLGGRIEGPWNGILLYR